MIALIIIFVLFVIFYLLYKRDRVVSEHGSKKIYEDKKGNWYFFDDWGNKKYERDCKKGY